MPLYVTALTVPANTSVDKPVEAELTIEGDVLRTLWVHFPDGCVGLVGFRLMYGIYQVAPKPMGVWLAGNGETVQWLEYWVLPESPCVVRLQGCSPGTEYDHTLIVRLETVPEEEAFGYRKVYELVGILREVLGL